jgi:hypothetical protein
MNVIPDAFAPEPTISLDSDPNGTHIRVPMTPWQMRTFGELCIRMAARYEPGGDLYEGSE